MKIIISERQQRLIKENSMKDKLINQIKEEGWESTSEMVGGDEVLMKLLKIDSPMDFLHLFDDLDIVQSEEESNWTLFRYEPQQNVMLYGRKEKQVYISYLKIWSFLEKIFGLNNDEIEELIQEWVSEVYDLTGVKILIFGGKYWKGFLRRTI